MATGATHRRDYAFDTLLEMKDAGALTASAAAQVSSADKVIDLGAGRADGTVVIDVSAIEIDTNDEVYHIFLEGAEEIAMDTTLVPLAQLQLGALEVLGPGSSHFKVDSATGRYELHFTNERGGTQYRYVRLYIVIAGTITTGINFTAFIGKLHQS